MSVQALMHSRIDEELRPSHLQIENESNMHGGAATESHFKLTVVSDLFENLTAVKRHQKIYRLLADQLSTGVHALALHLYTPAEWQARQQTTPDSPNCLGGSKAET